MLLQFFKTVLLLETIFETKKDYVYLCDIKWGNLKDKNNAEYKFDDIQLQLYCTRWPSDYPHWTCKLISISSLNRCYPELRKCGFFPANPGVQTNLPL